MTLLLQELTAFRDARGWSKYHTPRNLAEALSVEAGELLQCFLWDGAFDRRCGLRFGHEGGHLYGYQGYIGSCPAVKESGVASELADVLIYALSLCLVLDLDPDTIIREKIAINAAKYPLPA